MGTVSCSSLPVRLMAGGTVSCMTDVVQSTLPTGGDCYLHDGAMAARRGRNICSALGDTYRLDDSESDRAGLVTLLPDVLDDGGAALLGVLRAESARSPDGVRVELTTGLQWRWDPGHLTGFGWNSQLACSGDGTPAT